MASQSNPVPTEVLRLKTLALGRPGPRIGIALNVLFLVIAVTLVRDAHGARAIRWMNIYRVTDFPSFADALRFVAELRIPIPPILGVLEIVNHQLDGTTWLVSSGLYRLGLVFAYVLAMAFARTSITRLFLSFGLSVAFLWSTLVIHPGNPQVYDLLFPAFVLAWAFFLERFRNASSDRARAALALAAGFFLSMAELSRPFVALLLPLLLFGSYLVLSKPGGPPSSSARRRTAWGMFLLPLLIFSGSWHAHLLSRHGQLTWSNHSGFNMQRAWRMAPLPDLVFEPDRAPLAPERWPNLNTAEHHENSRRLRSAIGRFIVENPGIAVANTGTGLGELLAPATAIYNHEPDHAILAAYPPLVWGAALWLGVQLLALARFAVRERAAFVKLLGETENLLLLTAAASIGIFAVGDRLESARFLISVLPFLAASFVARCPRGSGSSKTQADGAQHQLEPWSVDPVERPQKRSRIGDWRGRTTAESSSGD